MTIYVLYADLDSPQRECVLIALRALLLLFAVTADYWDAAATNSLSIQSVGRRSRVLSMMIYLELPTDGI